MDEEEDDEEDEDRRSCFKRWRCWIVGCRGEKRERESEVREE